MYFNDVASFFERTSYIFDGYLDSVYTLDLDLPHRAEVQIQVSAGSSFVVSGLDEDGPIEVGLDLTPGSLVLSRYLFTHIDSLSSPSFRGKVRLLNHDGSPVLVKQLYTKIPVAVSQTIPSRRTASILRLDTEGSNPGDFFVVTWPTMPGLTITQDMWVELEKLQLKGVLQEVTPLTQTSTGVFFHSGYVKVSIDEI